MRAVERESRYLHPKALARPRFHLITADHNSRGGRQRSPAGILEAFAWSEHRLLADDPWTAHFLHPPVAVRDLPVAITELDRFFPLVFDTDVVGPYVVPFGRR